MIIPSLVTGGPNRGQGHLVHPKLRRRTDSNYTGSYDTRRMLPFVLLLQHVPDVLKLQNYSSRLYGFIRTHLPYFGDKLHT